MVRKSLKMFTFSSWSLRLISSQDLALGPILDLLKITSRVLASWHTLCHVHIQHVSILSSVVVACWSNGCYKGSVHGVRHAGNTLFWTWNSHFNLVNPLVMSSDGQNQHRDDIWPPYILTPGSICRTTFWPRGQYIVTIFYSHSLYFDPPPNST